MARRTENFSRRRTRHIGNDAALFARQTVDNGGLADVRLTDDGDLDVVLIALDSLVGGRKLQNAIKQITRARAVYRRERDGLVVKAKLVKFVKFVGCVTYAVTLVDAGDNGLSALFEHNRNISVIGGKSRSYVAHKKNYVGVVNSNLRLKFHLRQNNIVGLGLNTARVDNHELLSAPFGFSVDSVACNAGLVFNDRAALAYKLIKKCALADVRSADNSYYWFCHLYFRPFAVLTFAQKRLSYKVLAAFRGG